MKAIIFEDENWEDFKPISYMRHLSQLIWGTCTILDSLKRILKSEELSLIGRDYIKDVIVEKLRIEYNEEPSDEVLLINARVRPSERIEKLISENRRAAVMSGNELVMARLSKSLFSKLVTIGVVTKREARGIAKEIGAIDGGEELLFRNYWEIIQSNGYAIASQARAEKDLAQMPKYASIKGPVSSLIIAPSAKIDDFVAFNTQKGPIIISEGVSIEHFSYISGPCYIAPYAKIHSALLRGGTTICEGCRIGGEIENSIIMQYTNKAHYGYVGDSIVGEWVNLGAGSTFSNLKNTYGTVKVRVGKRKVDTKMLKLGPIIGDMCKVSIGCMIYSGRRIGISSHLVGIVDEDIPSFTFYNGNSKRRVELKLESVLETQKRMMERRGKVLSRSEEKLISYLHSFTHKEREEKKVKKGVMR